MVERHPETSFYHAMFPVLADHVKYRLTCVFAGVAVEDRSSVRLYVPGEEAAARPDLASAAAAERGSVPVERPVCRHRPPSLLGRMTLTTTAVAAVEVPGCAASAPAVSAAAADPAAREASATATAGAAAPRC